ncbi:MAG: DUF362 domain-containing protein [Candidatus Brocadiae bacterium]|nr:DUF362 domain-containing protein [Candidatus Brocadiia bacterium]
MTGERRGITRRDFLRGGAGVAAAAAAGLPGLAAGAEETLGPVEKTRVVLVRDKDAIEAGGSLNAEAIQRMMDQGVTTLLGEEDAAKCWQRLVKPDDLVGIKSNVWAPLPTPEPLVAALKRRVLEAGVPAESVRVDDRDARRTLADRTALINARPLRTHHWAAIGGCLKNYIPFTPRPSAYHPDTCADLGKIWNLPMVKGKTRLNILVVLTPLFHGRGPHHFDRRFVWRYNGLLISQDPVAADSVGIRILEAKRRLHFGEDRPLAPLAKHVRYAQTRHGVGISDPKRIDLVKVGWQDDALV